MKKTVFEINLKDFNNHKRKLRQRPIMKQIKPIQLYENAKKQIKQN